MPTRLIWSSGRASLYLSLALSLVHGSPVDALAQSRPAKPAETVRPMPPSPAAPPQVHYGTERLPAPVVDMREALLAAVRSGRIEELKAAIQLNEMKSDLGAQGGDPIAHLKAISGDGEGREILAALSLVLETGYVTLPLGRDIENNRLYVWPYLAEIPLDRLTPAQQVDLLRLVPAADAKAMTERRKYTGWRLVIGADGTWHSLTRGE